MMADFVGENLLCEVLESLVDDLSNADDNGVIDQSNHGKAIGKLSRRFFCLAEAPLRFMQLHEATPQVQRSGPLGGPIGMQFVCGGRRHVGPINWHHVRRGTHDATSATSRLVSAHRKRSYSVPRV